ncbi:MAG: hypothetical protein R3B72_22360 [Polyangiaceae bacterium]
MLTLVEALSAPAACPCRCHETLSLAERTKGVAAMMRFDDIMRGWGVTPLYEPNAPELFLEAKMRADPDYRMVAVRDHACLYARLLGFAVHELIHALLGDPDAANWGVPWGLPYGVPEDLPVGEEASYLFPFNLAEACAWYGVGALAHAYFDVDWPVLTARDVGTYGFVGGRAVVAVPPGFRAVPHIDRQHDATAYYTRARKLEARARDYLDDGVLRDWCRELTEVEAQGRARRDTPFPDPADLATLEPEPPRPS